MIIQAFSADIFEHLRNHAQGAIVFGRTGFNFFFPHYSIFMQMIPDLNDISRSHREPWVVNHSRILEFKIENVKKYLYFLPNENNADEMDTARFMEVLNHALCSFAAIGVSHVCLNGARPLGRINGDPAHNDPLDDKRVAEIVSFLNQWELDNPQKIERIDLVSLNDVFTRNLKPVAHPEVQNF